MKKRFYWYLFTLIFLTACKKSDESLPSVNSTIIGWGDSLTKGDGGKSTTYLTVLAQLAKVHTINKGVSGELSTQIKDRMVADTALYKYPTIIWAGNNLSSNEIVKSTIAEMVDSLKHSHYIILGIINKETVNKDTNVARYEDIIKLNHELADTYGKHFIDVRSYLISQYNTNNPTDVKDHAVDILPASLRSDYIHLNAKGYEMVAKLVYNKIDILFPNSLRF